MQSHIIINSLGWGVWSVEEPECASVCWEQHPTQCSRGTHSNACCERHHATGFPDLEAAIPCSRRKGMRLLTPEFPGIL